MNEIWKEIKRTFKQSKLNVRWVKITSVAIVILLLAFILKAVYFPTVEPGEVANKDNMDDTVRLIDQIKNGEQIETDLYSEDIETTIKLFFVGANENSLDLFSSVISTDVIQNDFVSRFELDELLNKYSEAMSRISRNSTIESVDIVGSNMILGLNKRRISVDISYSDLPNPVRVSLVVQVIEESDVHDDHSDEYKQPLISQSVWEIIDVIEKGVE